MSAKIDAIITAAVKLVDSITPNERLAYGVSPTAGAAERMMAGLIRAVEAANVAPDEEYFTLLRHDLAAPDTIRFWAAKAESLARTLSNGPKCDNARRIADSWRDWQADNAVKCKIPD